MKRTPDPLPILAAEMTREIEEHLAQAPTRETLLRQKHKARLRINPRNGDTTVGLLCYVCAADLVQTGYACKHCRAVDNVVAKAIGTPLLTPNLFDNESPDWDNDNEWTVDPSAVVENRDIRVFTTSASNSAEMRPDVSMREWAQWTRPSLHTSAQAYIILLNEALPELIDVFPQIAEPSWIVNQIT